MTKTFAAQVNQLPSNPELRAALEYLCSESNKLYNCTTYLARQLYFKAGKFSNGKWLSTQMKRNPHMKALYTSAAQQTCISVGEAFKGYKELLKLWKRGELAEKPKPPRYRKSGGMLQISYPKRWLKLVEGQIRVPMGTACKTWFNLSEIFIPFPSNLDWSDVKELQIVPRAGYFDAVWVCSGKAVDSVELDPGKFLSIDPGLDNWLTCTTADDSFIIDGRHLKSLNQWCNKRISTIKEGKSQGFWCSLLDRITGKRNRQMRDAVNKAARLVVNHCLERGIGTLVFGWNKGQRQRSNMGRDTNQKFVQVPTARLKKRIEQLCEQYGIQFIEQEESYTSKASALDLDDIPVYGEKPEGWKPSGKRIKRGLYRSATGIEVNADCNGAWNIARKANVTGTCSAPARGVLTSPKRLRIWDLPSPSLSEVLKESPCL
jgi:IS605 OrfB family transposase